MNRITKILVVFISFCLCSIGSFAQRSMNLDFELKSYNALSPKNWYIGGDGFKITSDSLEKHAGKVSLKMEMQGNPNGKFGVFTGTLPIELVAGKNVEYKGWIKTKDVKNGYAGLWFRVDGEKNAMLGFDNMNDRGLKGDNEWTPAV